MAETSNEVIEPASPPATQCSPLLFSSDEETVYSQNVTSTLQIINLRSDITSSDLRNYFSKYGNCKVDKKAQSALVMFDDIDASCQAAQKNHNEALGVEVEVIYAEPAKKLNTVYLKNIDKDTSTTDLRKFLSQYGDITEIDIVDNCASVRFESPDAALTCFRQLFEDKFVIGKSRISMTKPSNN